MQISTFDPRNKSFCFRMDGYKCFFRKTGKCSLELTKSETEQYIKKENEERKFVIDEDSHWYYPKNSVKYCQLLRDDILQNGVKREIIVFSNSCGHYSFDAGQHRSCIGKRSNISSIPVEQHGDNESLCSHCSSMKSSLRYRIQALFRKSFWFIG